MAHVRLRTGRAGRLCPGNSDVNLFSYREGIVDFDASDSALDLGVAEQPLYGAQVPRSFVDQGCLRTSQRVDAEHQWIEADAGDPLGNEPRVLRVVKCIPGPRRPVKRYAPGCLLVELK
jgi:hypothetical protein